MPTKNGDVMKILLSACVGVIVTGISAWFAFGSGTVDKEYLEHYDKNYSCWAKDKDIITERMKNVSENNLEALRLIREVQKQQSELQRQLSNHLEEVRWRKEYGIEKKK